MAWNTSSFLRILGCGTALAAASTSSVAAAQSTSLVMPLPTIIAISGQANCSGPADTSAKIAVPTKAAIISGGVSKLEQLRLAQSQPVAAAPPASEPQLATLPVIACESFSKRAGLAAITSPVRTRTGDILDSRRIKIRNTAFDSDWRRVSRSKVSARKARRFVGQRSADAVELLQNVNQVVNRKIDFVDDVDQYRKGDYWATAGRTLRNGRGDCEDIAIAKMQLLAALGIRREDMTLTIARDMVRNLDHAVLVVRQGDQMFMLDNETDTLLDATESHEYRPIFSYSGQDSWLHGYSAKS